MNSEAEKYYRQAIDYDGSQASAYLNLGAVLHSSGQLDQAMHYYEVSNYVTMHEVLQIINILLVA